MCEVEWNLKLLKVKWEGIKGLSQTFIFHLCSPWILILFKYKTLEWRWYDFFHFLKWNGVFENIWISFGKIFPNSETLCNSMIFMREDKMTSSKHMKYESEVLRELNSKSFWNYFQFGVFGFYSNYFLQNKNIWKIG